jgi:hypothetical protein
MDTVELLVRWVSRPFRTDDGHPITGGNQRLTLEPDPPVERDRQVLDDDQDASST